MCLNIMKTVIFEIKNIHFIPCVSFFYIYNYFVPAFFIFKMASVKHKAKRGENNKI